MINHIKITSLIFLTAILVLSSCEKKEYSFGEFITPSNLSLEVTVLGVDAENPNGDGSGKVFISLSADDNMSYKITFGNKDSVILHSDTLTYKYRTQGTNKYTLTVNAIGTGGTTSTVSTQVTVYTSFTIPADMIEALVGDGTKIWMVAKDAPGHFGNDAANVYGRLWWNIAPNDAEKVSAYDDEISFTKDESDNIYMKVDNKGQSFLIGAATAFYGFTGSDGPYPLINDDTKKLVFSEIPTGLPEHTTSGIQFVVPGNGIIAFGAGGNTYEILEYSATGINLRSIGIDGNAWYQKLKVKE